MVTDHPAASVLSSVLKLITCYVAISFSNDTEGKKVLWVLFQLNRVYWNASIVFRAFFNVRVRFKHGTWFKA